ncbi:unnamed protein product [Larinioides sclopetarius]
MTSWVLAFAACVVVATAGRHREGDVGEYGKNNEWRKLICENQSDDLYQDMDGCFQLETQLIRDAVSGCLKKVMPESSVFLRDFVSTACEDKSLFSKFDECFEEYEADDEFKKQEEISADVKACYEEVLKKHDLKELLHYLEES